MKMALFHGFIAALAFAFMVSFVQGKPQIVEPFPLNLFPFEEENGQVSCGLRDTTGAKPDRIEFLKVSQFGDKTKIPDEGSGGHTYYSNSTEDSGKKLITTLHFNKVKKEDQGKYECVGHSSGKQDPYGFTINVITKSELPTAKMQSASVLLGKPAKLFCNITVAFTTTIKNILWIKNSEIINHVLYPVRPDSYSEALTFPRTSLQDGGDYTCVGLVSFRRGNRKMNMTFGIATLEVKVEVVVEVDRNTTDVYAVANGNATLECPISGESVDITWWRVDDDGTEIKLNMSQRFASTKACPKCHSILTIAGLGSDDQGKYACKVSGSSAKHFFDLFVNPETPTTETTKKPDIKSGSISTLYCIQSTIMLLAGLVAWLTR